MSTAVRLMSAEELEQRLPDHLRHELIRGELTTMTPAGFEHGVVGVSFLVLLHQFVKAAGLGFLVGPDTGFVLARNPDSVRSPDVAFVRKERVVDPRPDKFWEGAPDLAVEVISPSDTASAVDEKVQEWLDAGTIEVLVINPKLRIVKVFRHGQYARVLRAGETLDQLESVTGFCCPVDEIFA